MSDVEQVAPVAQEAADPIYNKAQLKKFGIFTGILIALFGLLLLFTLIARKSWNEGLGHRIQDVLNASGLSYTVSEQDLINSPFAVSCASYSLKGEGADSCHAVIIRIATMYGPLPAVYIYDEKTGTAKFVDFASLSGVAHDPITLVSRNSQITYWARRIPGLLGTAGQHKENMK